MAKLIVEWGRISSAQPLAVPMATAQAPAASIVDALRMAQALAHTMTEDWAVDADALAALANCTRQGNSSSLKANGRAVFWGARGDWFVSVTNTEKHAPDGGYRSIAAGRAKARWSATLATRQAFPLIEATRDLLKELRSVHAHSYPECKGDCPSDIYIRNAEIALNALEGPL